MDDRGSPPGSARGRSLLFALVCLSTWAALAFGHPVGDSLANRLFAWARSPGALLAEGGAAGFARVNVLLIVGFGLLGGLGLTVLALRLRGLDRRRLVEAAAPWAAWLVLTYLVWKCYVVLATELVHFFQYGLVAALAALALDRGRRPQLAYLLATALGVVDEVWQHYGLHRGDPHHWMDWSDLVLNAVGAGAGALVFTTLARVRGQALPHTFHLVWRALALAAVMCLPLLLLSPPAAARFLGSYPHYPFWAEYDNAKPVHWPGQQEGVPVFLASLLVLGSVVEPGRRALSHGALACLGLLAILAVHPQSRRQGQEVHEVVPTVRVPWSAAPGIDVDGRLDEPAWVQAARVGPFVDCASGRASARGTTHARLLWDDRALYLSFEAEDVDVWSRDGGRDAFDARDDEGIGVLIDDGGDEIAYYSFYVTASGTVTDMFSLVPGAPLDYNPDDRHIGLKAWDPQGVRAAVRVDGTLARVRAWDSEAARDVDRGYVAEIAIPWQALRTTSTPYVHSMPPRPGDPWRLELCRVERPRVPIADRTLSAEKRAEYQAWAPTYYTWFQVPSRFGVAEFVR